MALDPSQLIEYALDLLATQAQLGFEKTMETWDNHKTPVRHERSPGKRVVYVEGDVYFWLNFGTKVRHVMLVGEGKGMHGVTSVGKTRVRGLSSSGGERRGLIVSKKRFNFKGIDAREFDLAIIERIMEYDMPGVLNELADSLVAPFITVTRT